MIQTLTPVAHRRALAGVRLNAIMQGFMRHLAYLGDAPEFARCPLGGSWYRGGSHAPNV